MKNSYEHDNTAYEIGYHISGPIFTSYVEWIFEQAEQKQLSSLLFLARDGQLLHALAQTKPRSIPFHYIAASRKSWYPCMPLAITDEHLFRRIYYEYKTVSKTCDALRFPVAKLTPKITNNIDEKLSYSKAIELTSHLQSKEGQTALLNESKPHRDRLLEYLFSHDCVSPLHNIGIVDLGWAGTLQSVLDGIWTQEGFQGKIHGFYFGISGQGSPLYHHGFAFHFPKLPNWAQLYPGAIEMLCPADHGSVIDFEKVNNCIKPTYADNTVITPKAARQLHSGACNWANNNQTLSRGDALKLLKKTIETPAKPTAEFFSKCYFEPTLFSTKGSAIAEELTISESTLRLIHPRRLILEWPWPQISLVQSGLPSFHHWLRLKFTTWQYGWFCYYAYKRLRSAVLTDANFVSLDIFDTVLFRRIGSPAKVFKKLEKEFQIKNFTQIRTNAEQRCRTASNNFECTIDEIYQQLHEDTNSLPLKHIQQRELEIESETLYAPESARKLVNKLRKRHGAVIYISDMYLPTNWLRGILEREGVLNTNDIVWVSSEHRASKNDGRLFAMVRETYSPSSWHHYGDNLFSDCYQALRCGITPRPRISLTAVRNNTKMIFKRLWQKR